MSLFPDGRICQRCGKSMEVHVDYHCSVCGWKKPGEETLREACRIAQRVFQQEHAQSKEANKQEADWLEGLGLGDEK